MENKRLNQKPDRLQEWLKRKKPLKTTALNITLLPEGTQAPLSFGQQRLYFLQLLYPDNPFYHYAEAYKMVGVLQEDQLIDSFRQVATRYAILRTTFIIGNNNEPIQKVHKELKLDISTFDLRHLNGIAQIEEIETTTTSEATRLFDLENGPLVRISLLRLGEKEHLMVLTMHHMITDMWSMNLLRNEWAFAYQGGVLTLPPKIQYADYAWSQRQQSIKTEHLDYWQKKLAGDLPRLKLPTDHHRYSVPTFKGALNERIFSSQVVQQLQKISNKAQTTMFVLLLSVYKVLLYRYSGETDLLVGTPVNNRDHTSLEKLIGFFNETLVLRTHISGDLQFMDLVYNVRSTVLEAFSHKNVPFESLVQNLKPERYLDINPIFQVMFLYQKVPPTSEFGPDLQLQYKLFDFGVSKFDLNLYVSEDKNGLNTTFEYATDLFEHSTIDRMQGHLSTLIEEIAVNPHQRIGDLPMLTQVEREHILEWNKTKAPVPEVVCVHQLIEAQAMANPDKPAVLFQNQSLTYGVLNNLSNEVRDHLQYTVKNQGSRIGLCTDRSNEFIIGMLGILKAGHAYVPIDPEYPSERIGYMIHDAEMPMILTQHHLTGLFEGYEIPVHLLGTKSNLISKTNAVSSITINGDDIAYVMYTSGSTGQPKGVPVSHNNLLHSTTSRFSFYSSQPMVFLLLSSFSFDSSVAGIFWSLCSGGTLVLSEHRIEQDLDQLSKIISEQQVTHTLLLPSLYKLLLQHVSTESLISLNIVIVAGEECLAEVSRLHFQTLPGVTLYNEYGPTEATVWSIAHRIRLEDTDGPIPIGRPIANTKVYILDSNRQLVPVGVTGELYIGGPNVVQGYLGKQELTKMSFVSDPFSDVPSDRLYKTGDLGRYRSDGIIEFLGRVDHQLKIRGHRIEPGEVQKVLSGHPEVHEAVVIGLYPNRDNPKETIYDDLDSLAETLQDIDPETAEHLLRSVELSVVIHNNDQ